MAKEYLASLASCWLISSKELPPVVEISSERRDANFSTLLFFLKLDHQKRKERRCGLLLKVLEANFSCCTG
jgi:hypothetical protein